MSDGKVSINTDVASSIVSAINHSCTTLESGVSNQLPGGFNSLVDLGLISSSVTKIKEQTDAIILVEK